MIRMTHRSGLAPLAAAVCLLIVPGLAEASAPHGPRPAPARAPRPFHIAPPPHMPHAFRPPLRSVSGHVSPYAERREQRVNPGDVDAIRAYYQRDRGRDAAPDPAADPPSPGGPP